MRNLILGSKIQSVTASIQIYIFFSPYSALKVLNLSFKTHYNSWQF